MKSVYTGCMEMTLLIRVLPDAAQAAALKATVARFNEACNWIAGECFARKQANRIEVQRLVYREVRERFGLTAQTAILAIRRACEAYKRDKTIRPKFRKDAAIAYDARVLRFLGVDRVNLWTVAGRLAIPILMGRYQQARFSHGKGETDLVCRKGKWFLLTTVKLPEGTPIEPTDFLGVDLGVEEIAADSDGNIHSGAAVEKVRRKHNLQRRRLQRRNTKGARKKLKRIAGKEARFRRHENHVISKAIVDAAKGTGRGIAVEDLGGIRDRITAMGSEARNRLSGWSFAQLAGFIAYKARLAGVPVTVVDPAYTSQTCSECGHRERANRKSRSAFRCKACGHEQHADVNAALNIRNAALSQGRALGALKPPQDWQASRSSRKSHVL
jgi:IS605 OrfB family transposase